MKKSLALCDSHFLCHRAKYKMAGLTYHEMNTGVIFGFLNALLPIMEKFHKVAFAWDSKKSVRRTLYYEGYKSDRGGEEESEETKRLNEIAIPQFYILRDKVLPEIGFRNLFLQVGYEADDIMASLVEDYSESYDITIISKDNDLYQLLDRCSMWNPDDEKFFTEKTLMEKWGVPASLWVEVKKIAGCGGDCVPNVPKVKEQTAVKYLLGTLPKHHKTYQNIISQEGQEIIDRNEVLVSLPLEGTKSFELLDDHLDFQSFLGVCSEYGFTSFVNTDKFDRWRKVLTNGKE